MFKMDILTFGNNDNVASLSKIYQIAKEIILMESFKSIGKF